MVAMSVSFGGHHACLFSPRHDLPQTLADRMAEGLDITFGCVVTRVAWGDDDVTVTCEDGRTFAADALILTVSLGVLKVGMKAL